MMRRWIGFLTIVAFLAATPPTYAREAGPIKIAFLGTLSAPFAPWGIPARDGMKMAVAELNEKGGVLGRKLELVERDDKNRATEGITAYRYFVEREGVVAVGGVISSDVGLAVSREAEAARVPLFLTMSGSHKILTKRSRYTFRTCLPAAPMTMEPVAAFIKERNLTRVAGIFADYEWGHALLEGFNMVVKPLPGVKTQTEVAPVSERDFTPYLRKLQSLNPELIVSTGHPVGDVIITRQAIELGMKVLVFAGWPSPEFAVARVGEPGFGVYVSSACHDYESPAYQALAEKFYAAHKRLFDHNAFSGYVTVKLVADAIERMRSTNPKVIADAIRTGTFVQEGYGWPLAYTEWGEMKGPRPAFVTFEKGDPGKIFPGATWRPRVIFRSPPIQPYVPTE